MCTEQGGIRMLMLLLHIWGIPGSNFSMETSCLETSYLDGCQCQHITSNEVVTTCLLILSDPLIINETIIEGQDQDDHGSGSCISDRRNRFCLLYSMTVALRLRMSGIIPPFP
jgi:hypothetical protein